MKHLFLVSMLFCLLCSCSHLPDPPLYTSRFHAEKDAFMPNGWRNREDGFFSKPEYFELNAAGDKHDPSANLFTMRTNDRPALCYYCGYYDVNDDSILDIVADAKGRGSFSLGVDFCDAEQNLIGERHQGFNLNEFDESFKNYSFRLFFLANENCKARYVRLMFIVDPDSEVTFRGISLNITPYEINQDDATYLKFKKNDVKQRMR
ncbi:MAG: hypothetical protein IKQ16_04080 [Lentisphaeria bacterium]|nr:hypothetical protein [Lentisphaeria bacterium]